MIKLNSGAAIFGPNDFGIGVIMRDELGTVKVAISGLQKGSFDVEVLEGIAARICLQVAANFGFASVVMESDNLKLVKALQKQSREKTNFGAVVNDILILANNFNSISYSHVKRSANMAAHSLAKMSMSYPILKVWLDNALHDVMEIVNSDKFMEE